MKKQNKKSTDAPLKSWHWKLAVGIILLGMGLKLVRLGIPNTFYFDEVYHAWTAELDLHNNREAYNPWNTISNNKTAVEWTHPPLSKLMMAGFMAIFGDDSFGWRIGSVLTNTAAILLASLLSFELFGSSFIALLTAYLLTIEGLMFAQSRIAMNDSYFIFFLLATLVFFVRWKKNLNDLLSLALSGIFMGLAVGTKWTGFYLVGIVGANVVYTLFRDPRFWNVSGLSSKGVGELRGNSATNVSASKAKERRLQIFRFLTVLGCLTVLPGLMYLLCYTQFFLQGWTWSDLLKLQDQMWSYHTRMKDSHPYQSTPFQWIFNLRPVWMYANWSDDGESAANIYNIGNSVILLSGLIAILSKVFTPKKWTRAFGFVAFLYFGFWVPWIFSPRIMLFYHYLPAVPFLCIILACTLSEMLSGANVAAKRTAYTILAAATLWFVVFYPHQTAIEMPISFENKIYFALPSWK